MQATQLITRSSLDGAGFQLDELLAHLARHADGSVSHAHGITALRFTAPVYDSYGNNVQHYEDSAGQVVGTYMLRFVVGSTVYYAPAVPTALTGQALLGPQLQAVASATLRTPGGTALATDFDAALQEALAELAADHLLPHTLQGHWETHAPFQAIARTTLDSAGHTVGRAVLVGSFRGARFELPCDTRLGGPIQPPRAVVATPDHISVAFDEGEGYADIPVIALTVSASGTRPFQFIWQMKTAGDVWLDLTDASGASQGERTSYDNRLRIDGTAVNTHGQSVFTIQQLATVKGRNTGQIRCVVSNSAGSASVVVPVSATDDTSCAVFSASVAAGYCDVRYLADAVRFRLGSQRTHALERQEWGGYMVLGRWIGAQIRRQRWYSRLLFHTVVDPLHQTMRWRHGEAPRRWGAYLMARVMQGAFILAYYLRRQRAEAAIQALEPMSLVTLYKRKLRRLRKSAARRRS